MLLPDQDFLPGLLGVALVVNRACEELGVPTDGTLQQKAALCYKNFNDEYPHHFKKDQSLPFNSCLFFESIGGGHWKKIQM